MENTSEIQKIISVPPVVQAEWNKEKYTMTFVK